jgi:hypothetical protein
VLQCCRASVSQHAAFGAQNSWHALKLEDTVLFLDMEANTTSVHNPHQTELLEANQDLELEAELYHLADEDKPNCSVVKVILRKVYGVICLHKGYPGILWGQFSGNCGFQGQKSAVMHAPELKAASATNLVANDEALAGASEKWKIPYQITAFQTPPTRSSMSSESDSKIPRQNNCEVNSVMAKISILLLLMMLLVTSCATSGPSQAAVPRFNEQDQADLIVRYYSDTTSYVLKPKKTEGPFLTIHDKGAVLKLAKQQPGRQLAVVVLIHYVIESEAERVKLDWTTLLTQAGYRRVVFLRAVNSMEVTGLPILAGGI